MKRGTSGWRLCGTLRARSSEGAPRAGKKKWARYLKKGGSGLQKWGRTLTLQNADTHFRQRRSANQERQKTRGLESTFSRYWTFATTRCIRARSGDAAVPRFRCAGWTSDARPSRPALSIRAASPVSAAASPSGFGPLFGRSARWGERGPSRARRTGEVFGKSRARRILAKGWARARGEARGFGQELSRQMRSGRRQLDGLALPNGCRAVVHVSINSSLYFISADKRITP